MANIPIEKKSGTPWWLWLLGALLLLGLLLLLARGCNNDDAVVDGIDTTGTLNDTTGLGGTGLGTGLGTTGDITNIDDIFADTTNLSALTGRTVRLSDVPVTNVVGDSTFYVTSSMGQRLFVVLEDLGEDEGGPGDGSDGVYDVNEGQELDIVGELVAVEDGARQGLSGADLERVNRQGIMLRARRLSGGDVRNDPGTMGTGTTGTGTVNN